jgi:hypothetical protein
MQIPLLQSRRISAMLAHLPSPRPSACRASPRGREGGAPEGRRARGGFGGEEVDAGLLSREAKQVIRALEAAAGCAVGGAVGVDGAGLLAAVGRELLRGRRVP